MPPDDDNDASAGGAVVLREQAATAEELHDGDYEYDGDERLEDASAETSPAGPHSLDFYVLSNIFARLSPHDAANLSATSRRLREAAEHGGGWRALAVRRRRCRSISA